MPFPSKPPNPPRHNIKTSPIHFSDEFNNNNYISQLEQKISIQSKKISELEKYKYLCEQFIKKINPYQSLPITEEMLSNSYEIVKDPINAAEQQNYTDLLKKTIENELIKNGLLNHNINAEGVIDLAKIRLESEEYKKQLVLAQSMIDSLKTDLVELTKENEEFKMNKDKFMNINNNESINMNNQIFDINKKLINYKNKLEQISKDYEKLLKQKKNIKNENTILKKEISQLKTKINDIETKDKKNKNEDNNDKNNKDGADKITNNNNEYKKKYEELLENINKEEKNKNNESMNISSHKDIINYNKIKDENNKLKTENEKQKECLQNLSKDKNNIEKENEENKNKIIELNKKYEKEKEQLEQEINKLKEKIIEKENDKENYNYYIEDDTEDENFFGKKKSDNSNMTKIKNNNESKSSQSLQEKYNELNNKYNDILNKYNNMKKEKEKIKEIFSKRYKNNKLILDSKRLEIKKLIEESIEFKKNDNDSFDYNRINYMLWELDDEIKEKEKIIKENNTKKEELENEVTEKFKYYDEYITNNKISIKKILSNLLNLLIQFKEKSNIFSKNLAMSISPQFISDTDKILNQINTINNITNYDIELNDTIFFDTINYFISALLQELSVIYDKNKNYGFYPTKNEEFKNNNEELYSKINNLKNDRNELIKDYSEMKKKNYSIIKENTKLKNDIIDLDNKLKEITLKYNCNQKTVLINNEGKKNLLNIMYKFIKNIYDKELAKIMYDILNIIEQINSIQLNKCIVEEKLNVMGNNENIMNYDENELGTYLLKERKKLENLIDDYDNKILEKKEILQKIMEDYNMKENLYSNYVKEITEKNEFLINDNEDLRNKLLFMEKEKYNLKDNYILDKDQSDKETYQNSSNKIYNKTIELLDKNKKINNFEIFG